MKKDLLTLLFMGSLILHAIPAKAIENFEPHTKYPNYSEEFTGVDKWEGFNRKSFAFTIKANKYVLHPVSVGWASIMPKYGMDRITDFYTNMKYPIRLASTLIQGDFESAGVESKRVLINTSIGLAGLFDPATNKFHIAARDEDMAQALASRNFKQGPYLVQGNVRDLVGMALDAPLNPSNYIGGGNALASLGGGLSSINGMTIMQPLLSMVTNYADPYEASKQLRGINQYVKNNNLDRRNFMAEPKTSKNIVNINNSQNDDIPRADISLGKYNPQDKETDALRTMLFDKPTIEKSRWAELSVWNKSFNKQIKTASISIDQSKPNYEYRYVIQKDKSAPIAILYPAIGEGVMSTQSAVFTKMLYDEGYSVVIIGSSFNWAFAKSMPDNFRPGVPSQDAHYMRIVTAKALDQLQKKQDLTPDKKIVVGLSFGALTGLFVDEQEQKENTLGISKYICICPPVQVFYAMQQIDKFSKNWKPSDIKEDAAVTTAKVMQVSRSAYNPKFTSGIVTLPFSEDESKLAISSAMRQKLYDLIFTIEGGKVSEKSDLYESFSNMDFNTYVQKYIVSSQNKPLQQLTYDSSLYSLSDFLSKNKNYKIYHSIDDCFTTNKDISWLKNQTGDKTVLFDNGSHLGFLYRKEFLNEFIKDTKLKAAI